MSTKCNLIIDSCCDLPLDMVQMEGIDLLYFPFIIDDVIYDDDFYQSRTPKEFYDMLREGASPSTSQVAPLKLDETFRKAAQSGVPTVYLGFSSGLSSNFESCERILEQVRSDYPEADIKAVDLLVGSTPEGLLVYEALRQWQAGLSAQELVAWAEEARYFVHTLFMVDDLDALHRGGRIPASVAFAGSKLNLKPLLTFDTAGKLSLSGAARGRKKGLKALADDYFQNHDDTTSVVLIGHADCEKDVEKLREILSKENEGLTVITHNIGATIGSHVGANMVSISFWGPNRRESLSVADRIAKRVKGE